ncbi:MAG TPA: DinB family protein [Vicinamibacterales bacterium]|nr:DinB family protein [Vicinamibacterales bacterium]
MIRAAIAEARVFDSWLSYQEALARAVAPLTEAQLRQRPLPGHRSIGEIAEHIVFGRALHLHRALGEKAHVLIPLLRWDAAGAAPRSATEIVQGLEATWQVLVEHVMCGAATDDIPTSKETDSHVIWNLLDHDLPHAGQLSLLLRACGLPALEV